MSLTWPAVVGAWDYVTLPGLSRLSKEIGRQSAMIAYLNTFGLFTLVSAVAVPISLLIARPKPAMPARGSLTPATTSPSPRE